MIRERERQVMNGALVLAAGITGLVAAAVWFIYGASHKAPAVRQTNNKVPPGRSPRIRRQ